MRTQREQANTGRGDAMGWAKQATGRGSPVDGLLHWYIAKTTQD